MPGWQLIIHEQVPGKQGLFLADEDGTLNDVFEFAHIASPLIFLQQGKGIGGYPGNGFMVDSAMFLQKVFRKMEREMVEMIVDLTKKIIHFDMAERGESVQDIIRLAVQSILDRETLVIKVHPEDKTYAESYRPELTYLFKDIRNISFEAHPSIPRGGCQVESNFGMVEARLDRLDEQIDKILHMAPPKLSPTYPAQAPEPEKPQSQGLPGVPNITPQPAVSSPPVAEKPKARPAATPKIPEGKLWWKQ